MKRALLLSMMAFLGVTLLASLVSATGKTREAERLTKEELKSMLQDTDLVIIDVRPKTQWEASESKLPGAVNEDPFKAEEWGRFYSKDMTVVLY